MNKKGFTLVSVLMSVGLLSVVFAAMAQMGSVGNKTTRTVSSTVDLSFLRSSILRVVTNQDRCVGAFETSPGSRAHFGPGVSDNLTRIVQRVGGQSILVASEGQQISPGQSIREIKLEYQVDEFGAPVNPLMNEPESGKNTHFVNLFLELKREGQFGGEEYSPLPIPLEIITDGTTDEIQSCFIPPAEPSTPESPSGTVCGLCRPNVDITIRCGTQRPCWWWHYGYGNGCPEGYTLRDIVLPASSLSAAPKLRYCQKN